jgi:hypothetical protein
MPLINWGGNALDGHGDLEEEEIEQGGGYQPDSTTAARDRPKAIIEDGAIRNDFLSVLSIPLAATILALLINTLDLQGYGPRKFLSSNVTTASSIRALGNK